MLYEGVLRKMKTEIGDPIQYYLLFENDFLNVNQVLNTTLSIAVSKISMPELWFGTTYFSPGILPELFL